MRWGLSYNYSEGVLVSHRRGEVGSVDVSHEYGLRSLRRRKTGEERKVFSVRECLRGYPREITE